MPIFYFLIKLEIRHGEYSFEAISLHTGSSNTNIYAFARKYASEFYGAADEYLVSKDDYLKPIDNISFSLTDYFYFHCGEIAVKVKEVKYITEDEYKILNKYI